jgi:hypothetical protein
VSSPASVTIRNEFGQETQMQLLGSGMLVAPGLTGFVSGDGQTINWSNGTWWSRQMGR